jgi:hypothetical protein
MSLFEEILSDIFKYLKIDEIYGVRVSCKQFYEISKRVNIYCSLKVLKRIQLRGTSSKFLIYTLDKIEKSIVNFNYLLQDILLLHDRDLLNTIFDYRDKYEDYFKETLIYFIGCIDYTDYFRDLECFTILMKRTNIKFTISHIETMILLSEQHYYLFLKYQSTDDYFSSSYPIKICVQKSYIKCLNYILNKRLKYNVLFEECNSTTIHYVLSHVKDKRFLRHACEKKSFKMFTIVVHCIKYEDESIVKALKYVKTLCDIEDEDSDDDEDRDSDDDKVIDERWFKREIFKSQKSIMISQKLKLETLFKDPKSIKDKCSKCLIKN